jgi:hypothetical protein
MVGCVGVSRRCSSAGAGPPLSLLVLSLSLAIIFLMKCSAAKRCALHGMASKIGTLAECSCSNCAFNHSPTQQAGRARSPHACIDMACERCDRGEALQFNLNIFPRRSTSRPASSSPFPLSKLNSQEKEATELQLLPLTNLGMSRATAFLVAF